MFNSEIFKEKIKRLIKERNTTQEAVARSCGISPKKLSQCLNGKQSVTADDLFSLANYFGVSADYLGRDGDSRNEGMTCQGFCRMIAELATNGQLIFYVSKLEETIADTDEYGEWSTYKKTRSYPALVMPRYEQMNYYEDYSSNSIYENVLIDNFLESLAQISKNMRENRLSMEAYMNIVNALLKDVPADMPLYHKKSRATQVLFELDPDIVEESKKE